MKLRESLLILFLGAAALAPAQAVIADARLGGYAYNSPYNRLYNLRTQITFTGTVTGIQKVAPMPGMAEGTTLLVKNDSGGGTAIVELGPSWFVDRQITKVRTKQHIMVIGSKGIVDGRGVIFAKLVKVGKNVLALRRPNGVPYWDAAMPAVVDLGPDPNQVEITGTVEAIRQFGTGIDVTTGMVLQTANGAVTIDLGPYWYYQQQGFAFPYGTTVTVMGPGNYALTGGRLLPAYWLNSGGRGYYFRDPVTGYGYWTGGGG